MFGTIIGVATVISSYALKLIGFPSQIRKMKRNKNVDGLSPWLIIFSMTSYILWTLHGVVKNDWVLILGQSIGVVMTSVIIYYYFQIKKSNDN